MSVNVISFNKASAKELGWEPGWFGVSAFDWDLIRAIKAWQRSHGLGVDGKVGTNTYTRLLEERQSQALSVVNGVSREVIYNRASARKLGWQPSWFGAEKNDERCVEIVRRWQDRAGLGADGMVGESSYRRVVADRESRAPVSTTFSVADRDQRHIVFNGNAYPIAWPRVVLWNEQGGLRSSEGHYRSRAGRPPRDIKMFVNHWDVCLSASQCWKIVEQRGISVHFCLDNDGTIYQLLDMQHVAWHAKGVNDDSVGVEISNCYDVAKQSYYERKGFGPRPIMTDVSVHGNRLGQFLGFYDVQLAALKALWKAVHLATGLPLNVPTDAAGRAVEGVDQRVVERSFRGFVNHYNVRAGKIDCAGLDMLDLLEDVKSEVANPTAR